MCDKMGFLTGPFCLVCGLLLEREHGQLGPMQPCPECGAWGYRFDRSVYCPDLAEDETCAHVENMTPECHEFICPKRVDRLV
jgi:hypothetical protein